MNRKLKIRNLIRNTKLSIETMEKWVQSNLIDDLDWLDLCLYQELTEDFIERHSNSLNWVYITTHQKLSIEFIVRNIEKIKWNWIMDNPSINHIELEEKGVYLMKKIMG